MRFGDSFTVLVYARARYALFKGDTCHTFASQLLTNGAPIIYVKEQMGHASIQTTVDIYRHLIQGANRNEVNRFDDAAFGGAVLMQKAG